LKGDHARNLRLTPGLVSSVRWLYVPYTRTPELPNPRTPRTPCRASMLVFWMTKGKTTYCCGENNLWFPSMLDKIGLGSVSDLKFDRKDIVMKRALLLSMMVASAAFSFAQSFNEGFDPGLTGNTNGNSPGGDAVVLPSGTWHADNDSAFIGSTGWFTNTVFAPHAGSGQLNANFNSTGGNSLINNFFMSPVRTFNNGDVISFYTRTVDAVQYPDRLFLKLSTNGASTNSADFTTTLLSVNPTLTTTGYPNVWTQYSVTLSGLGGPTSGRFAFNYNVSSGGPAGANSDYIGIDTVSYSAVPEPATMIALGAGALALARRRRKA